LVVKHYQSDPIPEEKPTIQTIQQENQKPKSNISQLLFFPFPLKAKKIH
jgi:hypothetical protein